MHVGKVRKWALLSACAVMTMTGAATTAMSQEAEIEELIVTGSRIRQNPLEARTPIMNLSEADIERSGRTSVADYLGQLAITGSAINAANNTSGNLGFPPDGGGIGAGQAEVDLRNLTSKRTLVLVDGRRWISGTSASGVSVAVDLNSIPLGAIERIEILQDGASPIYGSDAIAGVVNIITKRDYDGLNASAYYGMFDQEDGEVQEYEISFGASGERSRIFLDVSYTKSNEVLARDRAISEFPVAGATSCTAGGCSSGTPQARVFFFPAGGATADITLNDGVINDGSGPLPAFDPLNPGTLDFHDFTTADRFNFQPFNFLKTPNTRINIFAKAEYDLTDEIMFNVTASFNNRRSANQAAPEPLFIGPDAGNGNLMDTIGVDVTNPFNPFGVTLDGFAGGNFVFAGRRPLESGTRLFKQNVDTWTVMGSLVGEYDLGGKNVYWDIGVSWAQSQANQRKFGAHNSLKLKQALGPLADCVEVDADGDGIDDFTGCTPFNFFGGQGNGSGSITQAMLDFVGFIQKDESQQQMFVVTANATGDLIDLPGGAVGYAIGYEHRQQEGFFTPDAIVTAGNTAGVPSFPTAGQFNVDEFYGELSIPLIADAPFAKLFEISTALRISDYSLFGSNSVFKIGANWRVSDDLLIRGNFSEGFRAPGIGELFNTGSRFDSTLPDPCSDMLGLAGGPVADATTQANCITLGVPANGSYAQFNPQIGVNTGGSLDLTPETSESFTIGMVYDASWAAETAGLESLVIEVNYYDISVKNAIQAPVALDQLTACVATLDASLCDGINRTPTGVINAFENQLGNIGTIDTSGIDWTVTITTAESDIGQFRLTWANAYLIDYTETLQTATALLTFSREGTELGSPERGFNEYKSTLVLDWFKGDFSASYTGRYLSGLDEGGGTNRIPSAIYSDIQVTWSPSRWDNNVSLTLGVNNVFDTDIPVCLTCDLNSFDGTLHPIPGQFGYARLSIRM